tara:strand:- start:17 stop:1234 length:1218 start_codon:yes stop_codon:yes gene_type:complete
MTKARDLADLGNGVTEADIAASNSATNGYMLTAQSGNTGGLTWAEAPSSFAPVAVTGATPSLNVGTYNYFSGATFNADTTISFASVPTEANWRYSALIAAESGFELSNATWDRKSLDVVGQEAAPRGLFISTDGTELYMAGEGGDGVDQYTLSTAYNISTATHTRFFSISAKDNNPEDIFFKPDGTEMYTISSFGDAVYQWTLSTAWDISSATYTSVKSVAAQDTAPNGVSFKPDGLKMYVTGDTNNTVYQYTLSTAWLASSATYDSVSFSVGTQDTSPRCAKFSTDGTKMLVAGELGVDVNQYTLSTAWSLSTASYTRSYNVYSTQQDIYGLAFSADGSKMYTTGVSGVKAIYQYSTDAFATITLPAACSNTPTPTYVAGKRITLEFATLNGGTTVDVIQASVG